MAECVDGIIGRVRWASMSNEASPRKRDYRTRLLRFFLHYEPSQCSIIDTWLSNWAGREEELMQRLVQHHGPEPLLGAVPHSMEVRSRRAKLLDRIRELLQQFFLFYFPEKYAEVDATLLKWQGNEEILLDQLQNQAKLRDVVYGIFDERFSDRMEEVPQLLKDWLGHEEDLVTHLLSSTKGLPAPPNSRGTFHPKRRGLLSVLATPEVPVPFGSYRQQLTEFYRVFNPEKLSKVDDILSVYKGREEVLFQSLRKKYLSNAPAEGAPPAASFVERVGDDTKTVIKRLCSAVVPRRAGEVNDLLQRFEGTEAQLLDALHDLIAADDGEDVADVDSVTRLARSRSSSSHGECESDDDSETRENRKVNEERIRRLAARYSRCDCETQTPSFSAEALIPKEPGLNLFTLETKAAELRKLQQHTEASIKKVSSKLGLQPPPEMVAPSALLSPGSPHNERHALSLVLSSLGLSNLYPLLVEHEVDASMLPLLTHEDLMRMGIEGHDTRCQLIEAFSKLT